MPEPASNPTAVSEAASRRKWYRRPWVILTLAGLAVLGSIPFAVRGYQLSLIPDIPDPFADLPSLPTPGPETETDPIVDRYLQIHQRCIDWDQWIDADEPDHEDYEQFREELRTAREEGLAAATPRIQLFYRDNAALIDEWFAALNQIATKSVADRSSAIDLLTDGAAFDLLQISAQEHRRQRNPEEGLGLYLRMATELDRVEAWDDWEWSELWFFKVVLWKAIVSYSEHPDLGERLLKETLRTVRTLSAASDNARLMLFQSEFHNEVDYRRDPDFVWMSADYLSLPSWSGSVAAYVLGEPELSERILSHIYAGYRSQALLPRAERLLTDSLTVDSRKTEWFDFSGTGSVHEDVLKRAIRNAPLMIHFGARSSLFLVIDSELAWLRSTEAAIACQLHLREKGAFPGSLDDLVPGYLDSVPVDPWSLSGASFVYRINSDDVEIYSVGTNGTDDGGVNRDGGPRRSSYDPGFIIRDLVNHPE